LKHVTIDAAPGQIIAILGAPGSGKSTIVNLLPRFYDVTEGQITVDGQDIRNFTLQSLRRNVGIVQQDVYLFSATIRDNIAYGDIHASFEEVVRAAKIAQLHDQIMRLPDGYDTWVGERGVTLSGGQRQRLSIARTVLLDPPVLILDDSTSSVDVETERRIHQAMIAVMQGRTTFVIAHRLSTVRQADLILVLQDGEIVERGTHQELMARRGIYRDIYELQLRPQEERIREAAMGREHRGAN
jgi:ATP-binding cassette subfamily B protein